MKIFQAAVAAVEPSELVRRYLTSHPLAGSAAVLVIGAGKAAARMAAGAEAVLGEAVSGLVVVADGCEAPLSNIAVRAAGHPLPDARGIAATAELVAAGREPGRPVLCLISGGASSLLVAPASPLTLVDKIAVNQLLLGCGAAIGEMNTVRKHLSAVKGGGLLRQIPGRPMLTLLLSDVIGDDPAVIGSGPTVPDPTTFAEALAILDRHRLRDRVPPAVLDHLTAGATGLVPETIKPRAPETAQTEVAVVGSNRLALAAAATAAGQLGYDVLVDDVPLVGETRAAAETWLARHAERLLRPRACVIAGGETTVTVRGRGRGGRNQEFALALVPALSQTSIVVLSAGSDGIDGPTDAAGAFVDGSSAARAAALGLDAGGHLADNDAYGFFDPLGDLLRCGATGTNVMDIKVAVTAPFGDQ